MIKRRTFRFQILGILSAIAVSVFLLTCCCFKSSDPLTVSSVSQITKIYKTGHSSACHQCPSAKTSAHTQSCCAKIIPTLEAKSPSVTVALSALPWNLLPISLSFNRLAKAQFVVDPIPKYSADLSCRHSILRI